MRLAAGIAATAALAGLVAGPAAADTKPAGSQAKAKQVVALARGSLEQNDLKAVLVRVDVGRRNLVTAALGRSMVGVPATKRMRFRIGAMAIPSLITILLQLRDQGRLSLDDPLSRWFPDYPNADRITLRMLANNTSGYRDYLQGNPAFEEALYANVFRQWRPEELLDYTFARPAACDPGTCFDYSHANFVILSDVVHEVTGKPVAKLMRRRVIRPLGLRNTRVSPKPAIDPPFLHAYSSDRGEYEDSTFWSPSWSLGHGSVQTSNIRDVATLGRAIGTGELLSRRSHREQFAPYTASLPGLSPTLYYGLGMLVVGAWRYQNPDINGFQGVMAYLPEKRISIAIELTKGEAASQVGKNFSEALFAQIADHLAPGYPVEIPGA